MNKWIGIGRLTGDPTIKFYGEANDKKMARYTLAADRGIKRDPNNPDQQTADFIGCVCYGKSADFVDTYLRKGTKIAVIGRIQTGKFTDKDGRTVYTTDIMVENHEFCESKSSNQSAQATASAPAATSAPNTARAAAPQAQQADMGFVNIPDGIDEELPFR